MGKEVPSTALIVILNQLAPAMLQEVEAIAQYNAALAFLEYAKGSLVNYHETLSNRLGSLDVVPDAEGTLRSIDGTKAEDGTSLIPRASLQPQPSTRIDDPRLPISKQEERGRDRLPYPWESPAVGPSLRNDVPGNCRNSWDAEIKDNLVPDDCCVDRPPGHFVNDCVPNEASKVIQPPYTIGPPDILLINADNPLLGEKAGEAVGSNRPMRQIQGEHLVRQDGTVGLGIYGSVFVDGMTIEIAKAVIEKHLSQFLVAPKISLDIAGYNSKVYYVITDLAGFGQRVIRLPITGKETVLDAISQVYGSAPVSSKRIWVARQRKIQMKPNSP